MTEPLANQRHELFAQGVASGMAAGRAYEAAGYTARGHVADVKASALVTKGDVASRIAALKAGNAARAARSRDDAIADLESMAYGGGEDAPPVSHGDRIRAHTLLAKLHGWEKAPEPSDKAQQHTLSVSVTVDEAKRIARTRKGKT
jgi:hypothetical protein